MALSYLSQVACTGGGEEFLFRLNTLLTGRGYIKLGSKTSWPATYAGLASDEWVAWRNPSSALSRWELQAVLTSGTPDSIGLTLTPVVSEPCWTTKDTWGSNIPNAAVTTQTYQTDFRMSVTADDNSVVGFSEWTAVNSGFYVGRLATPLETATYDPHPVAAWGGVFNLDSFLSGWAKVYAGDMTTQLSAGVLLILQNTATPALSPTSAGYGQTTLPSANWHWETPVLAFNESGKRERVGRPDGVYVREDASDKSLWGANGEWAQVHGIIVRWAPGVSLATAYP